jgi:hypothetical protein
VAFASFRHNSRIDALSIIPNAQLERASAIPDIRFDIARLCVAERISYGLAGNRIDLVAQDRMQFPRRASTTTWSSAESWEASS